MPLSRVAAAGARSNTSNARIAQRMTSQPGLHPLRFLVCDLRVRIAQNIDAFEPFEAHVYVLAV